MLQRSIIRPMLLQRIQQQFIDSADLMYQCAQSMAPGLEMAVGAMLASVTGGGKVMACGAGGASAALAQGFVANFVGRFERDRPELAALALPPCANALSSGTGPWDAAVALSRHVRALGQPGDVLLLLTADGPTPEILAIVQAAHERDMVVVALCGAKAGPLGPLLKDTDVLVNVPTERLPRLHEAHLLALHCLCDGIDVQLLGDDAEPENDA